LIKAGGIRRHKVLSSHIAENFSLLLDGFWQETLPVLRTLMPTSTQIDERLAADFIDEHFVGFGPKQARNLLQWLGLARYEIPIDSRAVKWINVLRLGVRVDPTRLQDRAYYCEVLDVVQHVCLVADIYPTVLDAAGFASLES